MFASLLNQAKSAVSGFLLKYVARASVAIPFVIAVGFALAAITVMLVERFGHVTAYWSVAGGLALIGVIAAVAVSVKEHQEEVAEEKAEKADTELRGGRSRTACGPTPIRWSGRLARSEGAECASVR